MSQKTMTRKALQTDYSRKILSEISQLNTRLLILQDKPLNPEEIEKVNASKIRLKALYNYFKRTAKGIQDNPF